MLVELYNIYYYEDNLSPAPGAGIQMSSFRMVKVIAFTKIFMFFLDNFLVLTQPNLKISQNE